MSANEIRALEHRWFEAWNKGKAAAMAVIDELCAADYIFHSGTGEEMRGLMGFKQSFSDFFNAFPDAQFTIDDMIVEGDKATIRTTLTGTHKGEFMGIPPSNKKVTAWAISIDRVANGKFAESWERYDTLGLMQQLGVIPAPAKGR